jgi:hypothetical protein
MFVLAGRLALEGFHNGRVAWTVWAEAAVRSRGLDSFGRLKLPQDDCGGWSRGTRALLILSVLAKDPDRSELEGLDPFGRLKLPQDDVGGWTAEGRYSHRRAPSP